MKLFSHTYRLFWILILATYSYANTLFLEVFQFYHIEEPQWLIWFGFLLIVFLVWEGNRWIEKWVQSRSLSVHPLLQQFLISLFLAALVGWLVTFTLQSIFNVHPSSAREVEMKLAVAFSLRVNLFLQCIHAFMFFIQQSKEKEQESEKLKIIAADAELQRIKNQINPHFLFNNLNVLSSLVLTGSKEANTFIESFAAVYRQLLAAKDKDLIKLEEEISILEPYTYLLQKRFGDGLHLHIQVPQACMALKVVPASLQLLVENAIKHNVVSQQKPLHIYIKADQQARSLTVSNPIQAKQNTEESSGTGLKNIADRYKYAVGKPIGIQNGKDQFEVVIPLI